MRQRAMSDDSGSILMAMLLSIVVSGLLLTTFIILQASTQAVQSDRAFTLAIQVADAGLNQAVEFVNGTDPEVTKSLSSDDVVGVGNTATTTLLGETFSWTAKFVDDTREWQMVAWATVDGRTRTIEASAKRVGIFLTGAFADQRLEFPKNLVADSYPIQNVGSVGSNNTIIISNNAEPDVVVIAGDATCTQQGGPCTGEVNQDKKYIIQPSNRFEVERIRTQIAEDIAANCPVADRIDKTFTSDAEIATYFAGDGPFCFSNLTFGPNTGAYEPTWAPTKETKIYVDGDLSIPNGSRLNCATCLKGANPPNASLLQFYVNGDVALGNMAELGMAVAAPNGTCSPISSSAGTHIYGSLICSELIDNNGGWTFHYDTRLSELGASKYVITNWREEVGDTTSFTS